MGKTLTECKLSEFNPTIKMYECIRGYRCVECEKEFAKIVKKTEKPQKHKCPECKIELESQIMGIGHTFVQDIKTIGQLAEHNSKKMGTYEREDKEKAHYDSRTRGKIEVMKEKGVLDKNTSYQETQKEYNRLKKINEMTPQQKKDYVLYGKE